MKKQNYLIKDNEYDIIDNKTLSGALDFQVEKAYKTLISDLNTISNDVIIACVDTLVNINLLQFNNLLEKYPLALVKLSNYFNYIDDVNIVLPKTLLKKYSNIIIKNMENSSCSGKMENVQHLSTLFNCNCNCISRINKGGNDCICKECYATKLNPSNAISYLKNMLLLCTYELDFTNIYFYCKNNFNSFRFEAFGDLANKKQAINYINIAKNNIAYNFTLFTKNNFILNELSEIGVKISRNIKIVNSVATVVTSNNYKIMLNNIIEKYNTKNKNYFVVCDNNEISKKLIDTLKSKKINAIKCFGESCATCQNCYINDNFFIAIETKKSNNKKVLKK